MTTFKTQQPCDWYEDRVKFPCLIQAKIDGVASYNRNGKIVGRSLKAHENKFTTNKWSVPELHGFCGEMTSGYNPTGNDLCRITSGDLRRHEGEPDIHWWIFDFCTDETKELPYLERMKIASDLFLKTIPDSLAEKMHFVETVVVHDMQGLLEEENVYLDEGYEGAIIRDMNAPFKYGRCGKTFMGAWRIKRFIDAEFLIEEILEGEHNNNEAKTNLLGRTERSTMQENMLPNGMVGTLRGTLLEDVLDPQTKEIILKAGIKIDVAPGSMPHSERKYYFDNQNELLMKIGKFKLFPKGVKDKPRFAQFQGIRNFNDM